jgi:hypothetical protein
MPLVFSCSNAQILIDKSQTSHKTFIGNAIDFLIFKCSNFNWQITNITQDIYWQSMPLIFSSSNAQILIDKSQTSHKTFIGNAIGFLIFKSSNFYWQITNITQDIYLQCHWFSHLQILKFLLTNHKHHTRHLLAINAIDFLIFKCSNFDWQITNIAQDVYWQCHWFSHIQMINFLLTNHKHHTKHLLAMPLVFSSSNAQILIYKSQTSHKIFIGNAIGFLIFKCSNFN